MIGRRIFGSMSKLVRRQIHVFDIPEYHTFLNKKNEDILKSLDALPTEEQKISILEYLISTGGPSAAYLEQWTMSEPGLKFKEELVDSIHKLSPDGLYQFAKVFAYSYNKSDIQELAIKLSNHLTNFDPEDVNPTITCLLVLTSMIESDPEMSMADCISQSTIEKFYENNKGELAISHLVIVIKALVSYPTFNEELVYKLVQTIYDRRGNLNSSDFLAYIHVLLKIILTKYKARMPEDLKSDHYYQIIAKLSNLKLRADPRAMYNPMIFTNILSIMRHLNTDLEQTNLFRFLHEVFVNIYMKGLQFPHFIYLFEAITAKAIPFSAQEVDIYVNRINAEMMTSDFMSQALSALCLSRLAAMDVVDFKNKNLKQFKVELEAKVRSGALLNDLRADKTAFYYLLQISNYNSEFTDVTRRLVDLLKVNNMMDANMEQICNQFVK